MQRANSEMYEFQVFELLELRMRGPVYKISKVVTNRHKLMENKILKMCDIFIKTWCLFYTPP